MVLEIRNYQVDLCWVSSWRSLFSSVRWHSWATSTSLHGHLHLLSCWLPSPTVGRQLLSAAFCRRVLLVWSVLKLLLVITDFVKTLMGVLVSTFWVILRQAHLHTGRRELFCDSVVQARNWCHAFLTDCSPWSMWIPCLLWVWRVDPMQRAQARLPWGLLLPLHFLSLFFFFFCCWPNKHFSSLPRGSWLWPWPSFCRFNFFSIYSGKILLLPRFPCSAHKETMFCPWLLWKSKPAGFCHLSHQNFPRPFLLAQCSQLKTGLLWKLLQL